MKLIEMLPELWQNSAEVAALQAGLDGTIEKAEADAAELMSQVFVDTATWGLSYWEKLLGLSAGDDMTDTERRERIRAKLGSGTVATKSKIASIVSNYENGDVEITEDFGNYKIQFRFVSKMGVPSQIEALQKTIADVLPAHLQAEYIFTFRKWDELSSYTWDELSSYTWDEVMSLENI